MAICVELARAEFLSNYDRRSIAPRESLSLVPVIKGGRHQPEHANCLTHAGSHTVILGDYRIVREGRGRWCLHNLAANHTETKSLAEQMPDLVKKSTAFLGARFRNRK